MTSELPVLLLAIAGGGLVAGLAAAWWLRGHRYRLDEERELPRRRHWWIAVLAPLLVVVAGFGLSARWPVGVAVGPLVFVCAWLLAAGIDADVGRLPNLLTLPLAAAALVWAPVAGFAVGEPGRAVRAALAGLALAAGYLSLLVVSRLLPPHREAMGLGDVKLALSLGAVLGWFGWTPWLAGLVLTFGIGAVWALVLLVTGRAGRKDAFSFGPSLVIGTALALFIA
ncbi:MAG: A24 family peptidase [Propionicimonas sp.]|nr:A24 family peptidase [Propionicimonas sp.]